MGRDSSGAGPEDGDLVGIATQAPNVILHPLESHSLVQEAQLHVPGASVWHYDLQLLCGFSQMLPTGRSLVVVVVVLTAV
ncbi:hypothetical protein E2C01_010152 [Portunus trituberculatus]|uniref:Uncharacterized protein n=1 Tax=Portunus trituberculatus TaxID=210409 RepID=A0A5B7D7S0_PORTR|nr:hypothetical protein [Portunus trituberculatus]